MFLTIKVELSVRFSRFRISRDSNLQHNIAQPISRLRPRPLFKTLVQPPQRKIQPRQNHHQATGRAGADADDRVEFAMVGAGKGHGRHQAGQQDEHHPLQAVRHYCSPFAELDLPFPQPPVHAWKQQADGVEGEQAPQNAHPEHEFIHRLHPNGIVS